jgi:phasin family protein
MIKNLDEVQKLGKDNVEATLKSFGAASKAFQAIAAEVTNYAKKSFEDGTAAMERLLGAKTLEKAIEVQSEYVKTSYEGFVTQATKLGELYADLAKESYKPFEGYLSKVTPSK